MLLRIMNTPSFKLPESYSFKSIWRITFPILVALVMEELLGMTDTAFLGRVGEVELGASAFFIPTSPCAGRPTASIHSVSGSSAWCTSTEKSGKTRLFNYEDIR